MSIVEKADREDHRGVLYCMVKCDQCGRLEQKTYSSAKRSKRHFCDKECYRRWQIKAWQNGKINEYRKVKTA